MTAERLRIALVGAAGVVAAECHLNAIPMVERLELAALCDTNAAALERRAREHGVEKRYTRLEDALSDPEIDAVDIVTPPFTHAALAIAAAKAGKHVYVEKPMARSAGEARAMIAAARAAGVRLMVGESYVFHGPHVLARRAIEDGAIGEVVQVRQTKGPWVFREEESRRLGGRGHDIPWRVDPELSGGGDFPWMMDHGPHFFATARYLAGDAAIERVAALPRSHGFGLEAHLRGISAVTWLYEGGEIDGTWSQAETAPEAVELTGFRTEVTGTTGSIRVFGEGGGAAPGFPHAAPVTLYRDGKTRDMDPAEGLDRSWVSNNSYYDRAHASALRHFADAVMDGTPLRYDGDDGLADLTATLATIKSAVEGRSVALADVEDDWTAYGAG